MLPAAADDRIGAVWCGAVRGECASQPEPTSPYSPSSTTCSASMSPRIRAVTFVFVDGTFEDIEADAVRILVNFGVNPLWLPS